MNKLRRKIGLREVAQAAGCSKAAVSAVLNHAKGNVAVSPAMRQLIEESAKRLGYSPDYHAQVLAKGRANVIGLVLRDTSTLLEGGYFWAQFISGVEARVREAGNDLLLIGPANGQSELERGVHHIQRGQVDALIVPWLLYHNQIQLLSGVDGPIVLAYAFKETPYPIVSDDATPGVRAAVRHLSTLGHKSILWVGVTQHGQTLWPVRRDAFITSCRELDLRPQMFEFPSESIGIPHAPEKFIEAARRSFAEFLPRAEPFTAIIAYNEFTAIGASTALREFGLNVPQDVSLIGFDDIYARVTTPAMSVISLRIPSVGRVAADLALRMTSDPQAITALKHHREYLPMELIVRESTKPARKLNPFRDPVHEAHSPWPGEF